MIEIREIEKPFLYTHMVVNNVTGYYEKVQGLPQAMEVAELMSKMPDFQTNRLSQIIHAIASGVHYTQAEPARFYRRPTPCGIDLSKYFITGGNKQPFRIFRTRSHLTLRSHSVLIFQLPHSAPSFDKSVKGILFIEADLSRPAVNDYQVEVAE